MDYIVKIKKDANIELKSSKRDMIRGRIKEYVLLILGICLIIFGDYWDRIFYLIIVFSLILLLLDYMFSDWKITIDNLGIYVNRFIKKN